MCARHTSAARPTAMRIAWSPASATAGAAFTIVSRCVIMDTSYPRIDDSQVRSALAADQPTALGRSHAVLWPALHDSPELLARVGELGIRARARRPERRCRGPGIQPLQLLELALHAVVG